MNTSIDKAFKKTTKGNYFGYYKGFYIFTYKRPHGKWCCSIGKSGTWICNEGYLTKFLSSIKKTKKWAKNKIESLPSGDEPYFGWCDVDGCHKEGCGGGSAWRETGYWTVCYKHSDEYRAGKPQPKMKQSAIDREKRRGVDGVLVG